MGTINSIPSGWASIFHCGNNDEVRMPGIWLHSDSDDMGAQHQGFTIVFSTINNWNEYSQKATGPLQAGNSYHLEVRITQNSFVILLDGVIAHENYNYDAHTLNKQEPCYLGDPWWEGADVVVKNLRVREECHPLTTDPTMQQTPSPTMKPKPCGDSMCHGDDYCCNESCGICAPKGGHCTQQFCGTEAPKTPSPTTYLRSPKPTKKTRTKKTKAPKPTKGTEANKSTEAIERW